VERHFGCTACGKCCYGWLPLTLNDAFEHAGRFPLALVWRAVPQSTKSYNLAARLGVELKTGKRTRIAALIAPTAWIPPSFPCPELSAEGRCNIHDNKPQRCRTMPFYPYREEADQADMLVPRKGWECDTSVEAPLVYRDKAIVERADFDRERKALLDQAPVMQRYAEYMLKYSPWIADNLAAVAARPDGSVVTSLSSFLTATRQPDAAQLASQQLPVLRVFAEKTAEIAELAEYHRNYAGWIKEMEYLASRA
jgi:Fe-S-cluster containining protein